MCAMALLHSRVGRVFYGASDPRAGVLGSNGMLHEEKTINHRYRVFRRVLEAECQDLLSGGAALVTVRSLLIHGNAHVSARPQ